MAAKKQLIVIGDRILVDANKDQERTDFGLYLPPGVKEREKVRGGYVIKVGPGYPLPDPNSAEDEPWSASSRQEIKYIPLQARAGDYAIFINNSAVEIDFEGKHYLVVPQSAILVLTRDDLPELDFED